MHHSPMTALNTGVIKMEHSNDNAPIEQEFLSPEEKSAAEYLENHKRMEQIIFGEWK